jgi:hypothetical protein
MKIHRFTQNKSKKLQWSNTFVFRVRHDEQAIATRRRFGSLSDISKDLALIVCQAVIFQEWYTQYSDGLVLVIMQPLLVPRKDRVWGYIGEIHSSHGVMHVM